MMNRVLPLSSDALKAFKTYLVVFTLGMVVLTLIAVALGHFFDLNYKNRALGFILSFFAASFTGRRWQAWANRKISLQNIWKVAFFCTGITMLIHGLWSAMHAFSATIAQHSPFYPLMAENALITTGIIALTTLLTLVAVRIGLGMGITQTINFPGR